METFPKQVVIICDGGSLGNHTGNGGEGYGSFIITPEICPQRFVQHFGPKITNNEAEYMIIIAALNYLKSAMLVRYKKTSMLDVNVTVLTDSQLVVGHMTKNWKVKAPNLISHVASLSKFMHEFGSVSFRQEPRKNIYATLGH